MEETTDKAFRDIPAGMHAIAVLGAAGDTKTIWDATKPDEVEAARNTFTSLTRKGYVAFHVTGKNGEKGAQMREFDPNAERIIFVPPMAGG